MKIKSLELKDYRNINHVRFDFHKHLNIFYGENGQGKTNILEAIALLSLGRSFRINQDAYLIKENQPFSMIEATLENDEKLKVVISDKGKYLTRNQKVIEKLSDFIGICNVVLFHPDDLQFFTQSPMKRRKEIDYELGKNSHTYLSNLSTVNQLLANRNAFLKKDSEDQLYLDVIDEQWIKLSVSIIESRRDFIAAISETTDLYFSKLSDLNSKITIDYQTQIDLKETDYLSALKKRVDDNYRRDKEFRLTHVGIHRDDYIFKIDGEPIINVLSQGQRRLLIIAFKFAIINWLIQKNDKVPIFCMDDLFSELDHVKRQNVLDLLDENLQVFITTTDLNFIETKKDKRIFEIKGGNVV